MGYGRDDLHNNWPMIARSMGIQAGLERDSLQTGLVLTRQLVQRHGDSQEVNPRSPESFRDLPFEAAHRRTRGLVLRHLPLAKGVAGTAGCSCLRDGEIAGGGVEYIGSNTATTPYKPYAREFAVIAGQPETWMGWQEPAPSACRVRDDGLLGLRKGDGGDRE